MLYLPIIYVVRHFYNGCKNFNPVDIAIQPWAPCIYFLALTKSHAAACLISPTPFHDHVCCIYIAERNDNTIMQLRVWFLTCYSCVSKGVEYSEYKYISGNVIIH